MRPGNSSTAKAYAESTDVTTAATVTTTVTMAEFLMYVPRSPSLHAWRMTSSVKESGARGLTSTRLPGFREATTVV